MNLAVPLSTQSLERKKVSGNQKRCYVCAKLSAAISVLGTQAALPVTENNHQRCACFTPLCPITPCGPVGRQAYASLMGYRVPAHLPTAPG